MDDNEDCTKYKVLLDNCKFFTYKVNNGKEGPPGPPGPPAPHATEFRGVRKSFQSLVFDIQFNEINFINELNPDVNFHYSIKSSQGLTSLSNYQPYYHSSFIVETNKASVQMQITSTPSFGAISNSSSSFLAVTGRSLAFVSNDEIYYAQYVSTNTWLIEPTGVITTVQGLSINNLSTLYIFYYDGMFLFARDVVANTSANITGGIGQVGGGQYPSAVNILTDIGVAFYDPTLGRLGWGYLDGSWSSLYVSDTTDDIGAFCRALVDTTPTTYVPFITFYNKTANTIQYVKALNTRGTEWSTEFMTLASAQVVSLAVNYAPNNSTEFILVYSSQNSNIINIVLFNVNAGVTLLSTQIVTPYLGEINQIKIINRTYNNTIIPCIFFTQNVIQANFTSFLCTIDLINLGESNYNYIISGSNNVDSNNAIDVSDVTNATPLLIYNTQVDQVISNEINQDVEYSIHWTASQNNSA